MEICSKQLYGEEKRLIDELSKGDLEARFEELDKEDINFNERISKYFSIFKGCEKWIDVDKVYDMYIEGEQITSDSQVKKNVFRENFIANKEELDKIILEIKYRKIGNLFLFYGGEYDLDDWPYKIFNEKGEHISKKTLKFNPLEDEKIEIERDIKILPKELSSEAISKLGDNIKVNIVDLLKKTSRFRKRQR